jgi:hypothetical protein
VCEKSVKFDASVELKEDAESERGGRSEWKEARKTEAWVQGKIEWYLWEGRRDSGNGERTG